MKTDLHHNDHNLSGHMIKLNASIHIISSRVKCIKNCLESLWNNYNSNHNYPVYVYYFDDIYDSLNIQNEIVDQTGQEVVFKTVPYKTPDFIPENELYYNRKDIQYVNSNFSINRKGYLHMCNFTSNMYGYQNTELALRFNNSPMAQRGGLGNRVLQYQTGGITNNSKVLQDPQR